MSFKIAARTILQLGGELISSDAVALYELIKNAFDAGSSDGVKIDVVVRIPEWPSEFHRRLIALEKSSIGGLNKHDRKIANEDFITLQKDLIAAIDKTAPQAQGRILKITQAKDIVDLRRVAEGANRIVIRDTGHGMSIDHLEEVYLTIGTRYRLEEKQSRKFSLKDKNPILGEKGLGRLSVMRLGQRVRIKTTSSGETKWNILEIDWARFSHDSDELLSEIEIRPHQGEIKADKNEQGTIITVSGLNASWSKQKIANFAKNEGAKFNSPFDAAKRYNITLKYNDAIVPLLDFDRMVLNNSHAVVTARYSVERGGPVLRGKVQYKQARRERPFILEGAHLLTAASSSNIPALSRDLAALGDFFMEAYWFNRRLLQKKEDGGLSIGQIVNDWSGGLMLFRDGFRVLPYGEQDDDWLDLDRKALASQAYKVNRKQLIGRVEVSSINNPALTDQTNREGLRETPEKRILINLLKHILEVQLRQFLIQVDQEERVRLRLTFDELGERVAKEKTTLRNSIAVLRARHNDPKEKHVFQAIDQTVDSLELMMEEAQSLADEFERGKSQVMHLAGLGLMVEFLAHELNRSTQHALRTLSDSKTTGKKLSTSALENLELQLKTIQKRLSSLDPATTSGRNRKERFDLVELTQQVLDGHIAEFQRHGITSTAVVVLPKPRSFSILMVKGMIVQVLENLIVNAVYWLKQEQKIKANFKPFLTIELDIDSRELRVSDNGPGVLPEISDDIFKPFFTTKPPGEGKGLGLYISREIAHYHEAELTLSNERRVRPTTINTFVLRLPI